MLETALGSLPDGETIEFTQQQALNSFGDYQLLEEIGRGGQGVVYRARQGSLNRVVALKMIGLGRWASQTHLQRFRREAESVASLDHPGVVPIYEIGEHDGACYYTMKLVEGGPLDIAGALRPRRAAEIAAKLARILGYAHERGLLHRDIKPGNILFDAKGEPHLTDFGIARLTERATELTQTSDVLGTPAYMAPEQANGRIGAISPATDIYGLGGVLYQMLTGQPPFAGNSRYEIIRAVMESAPKTPRSEKPEIDRDLQTICLKCLEKEPAQRYPTALALAEDLEHWLRNEPIRARPAGVTRRTYKFVRRNPILSGSVLFLIIVATVWLAAKEIARENLPTADSTALELFHQARNLFLASGGSNSGKQDMIEASSLLSQAIARDPKFVDAYCELAWVDGQLYLLGHDHTPQRLAEAEAAANTALRLRPSSGEAHLARAQILYRGYLDYPRAFAELELASKSLTDDARFFALRGYILRRVGWHEEAVHDLERARDLDPHNIQLLAQLNLSYIRLRYYADVRAGCDRILALDPNEVEAQLTRAYLPTLSNADTKPWHEAIELVRRNNPAQVRHIADSWLSCAFYERDPVWAREALIAAGDNTPINAGPIHFNRPFAEAMIARLEKDEPRALAAFREARTEQEKMVAAEPAYAPVLCVLGLIDAGLGRKEEALREGRAATELLPPEKDAIIGPILIGFLAMNAAWVGENDFALEELNRSLRYPGVTDYGELKLSPFWDPLRGDLRFEAIVASFAPK